MTSRLLATVALALATGCYAYVPCESVSRAITRTEVTPLGFSAEDAASALASNETLALTYADGST